MSSSQKTTEPTVRETPEVSDDDNVNARAAVHSANKPGAAYAAAVANEESERAWIRRVVLLLTGQAFSLLGSNIVQYAIWWWIVMQTNSGMGMLLATLFGVMPQAIVSILGGSWADRHSRKLLIMLPDMVIVPGSKNTMSDLKWMRQNGMEAAILKLAAANVPVLGICGGYQMLGESIEDPGGEEEGGSLHGMGLLPVRTVFEKEKVQTRVTGEILQNPGAGDGLFAALCGSVFSGYEIHMGHTTGNGKNSFSRIRTLTNGSTEAEEDWQADGAVCGNVAGTYVHGLFEDGSLTKNLCSALLSKKGICAEALTQDYAAFKESQYDLLAAEVRKALDMEQIYRMMEKQEGDR